MRKISAAAGVHEFALLAFLGELDRRIAGGLPARLVPDVVDRMLENVELGLRETIAGNPQHVMGLDEPSVMTVQSSIGL